MSNNPLVWITTAFCAGIALAAVLDIGAVIFLLLAALTLVLSIISLRKSLFFGVFILSGSILLGAATEKNSQTLPQNHLVRLIPYRANEITLIGTVVSQPEQRSLVLKIEQLKLQKKWQNVCGKVLVKHSGEDKVKFAERLVLGGVISRPFSFSRAFDYRGFLSRQGIYHILNLKKENPVRYLASPYKYSMLWRIYDFKNKLSSAFDHNLSFLSAAVFKAMILGERKDLPAGLNNILLKTGTIHIIAISGFNVGIVAFVILLFTKIIRVAKKARVCLAVVLLIIYCILTGANPPVFRATIMAVILLINHFLRRQADLNNSLSLAALIILAVNPQQLFEISFQLSFLSIIALAALTCRLQTLFSEKYLKNFFLRYLILAVCGTAAAWLGLLPLIAYYFKVVTPVAILANLFTIPLASLITVLGLVLLAVSFIFPILLPPVSATCEVAVALLVNINSGLINLPGAYINLPRMSLIWVLFYYALFSATVYFLLPSPTKYQEE